MNLMKAIFIGIFAFLYSRRFSLDILLPQNIAWLQGDQVQATIEISTS